MAEIKKTGMHADGGGLYLHVSASGAKSWIFRWSRDRKSHDLGLGTAGNDRITLAKARDLAADAWRMVRDGVDPIAARKAARQQKKIETAKAMTFRQCAEAYIEAHQAGWRNLRHAKQWPATLQTYVYPVFGSLPVQAVDVGLVMRAIEPIWTTKPETASRVRGRIESVLDWATARQYRRGENPARWRGHLENLLPRKAKVRQVEHLAALPYGRLPAFMRELRQQEGIAARALEFCILTAGRTNEVINATWQEIDLAGRLWVVPRERMKGGREHQVPLSEPAAAILEGLREVRQGPFIFLGQRAGRPIHNMAMLRVLQRMGYADLTTHGFRSAFSDWVTEQTGFPAEARELALAHKVGDAVVEAYRRGPMLKKRRDLMEAWARFATSPPVDNVTPIRAAK